MKKVLLGAGAAVIVILLLLQTKFNMFTKLLDEGYIALGNSVKEMLLVNPEDGVEILRTSLGRFEAREVVYTRGGKYYIGEEKKEEVDLSFPLYIGDGSGILFMDGSAKLFDTSYETMPSFEYLRVIDKIAYNTDGLRSDADDFLFAELSNGTHVNFVPVYYMDRGEIRKIPENSLISFKDGYMNYAVFESGDLIFRTCPRMKNTTLMQVEDKVYTYDQLLILLGLKSVPKEKHQNALQGTISDVFEEIEFLEDELYPDYSLEVEEGDPQEIILPAPGTIKGKKDRQPKPVKPAPEEEPPSVPQRPKPVKPAEKPERPPVDNTQDSDNEYVSQGVRPDSARPDRPPRTDRPKVEIYEKPVVTAEDPIASVYRISVPISVHDPVHRLLASRRVQVEFYEQLENGSEKLVYRTYSGTSTTVEGGMGSIKPDTTYRVNVYFTYLDEFNVVTVESVYSDKMITTKPFSDVGSLTLRNKEDSEDVVVDYYYDNHLEIIGLGFDTEKSDAEAAYGIDPYSGITLEIRDKASGDVVTSTKLTTQNIDLMKRFSGADVTSPSRLLPNKEYTYTFYAKDFFENALVITNPSGDFETCKGRPDGLITLEKKEIGDTRVKVVIRDKDQSAIPAEGTTDQYDIYYVVMEEEPKELNPISREEVEAVLLDDHSLDTHEIRYAYKFTAADYLKTDEDGNTYIEIDRILMMEHLKLARKYKSFLYMDYDLHNRKGEVRFDQVGRLNFTSASLQSLGNVFVNAAAGNIKAHSAELIFSLNTGITNATLVDLITKVKFDIVRTDGEDEIIEDTFELTPEALVDFKNGQDILMDADNFGVLPETKELLSHCAYTVVPTIIGEYDGEEYELNYSLNGGKFMTLREPARVVITNDLLAAGTLRFNVQIFDPDDAITGNSGSKVVMNVHQQNGVFVTALRLNKNTEEPIPVEVTALNEQSNLIVSFIAVEYNEGYSNATDEPNKCLLERIFTQSVYLTGDIKLKNIERQADGTMLANTIVSLDDRDKVLLDMPYYIDVEEDGKSITEQNGYPQGYQVNTLNYVRSKIRQEKPFGNLVEGSHQYKMTLYVIINSQKLILDTLEFNTEEEVIAISTPAEFVWYTYRYPKAKFVVTQDLINPEPIAVAPCEPDSPNYENYLQYLADMDAYDPYINSTTTYLDPDGGTTTDGKTTLAIARHVNPFDGKIDFQGFHLKYNMAKNGASVFTRIGTTAEVYNMVLDVKINATLSSDGALFYMNFGHIHDVMVNYTGGIALQNNHFGVLGYINAASGLIENFVVANVPEGDDVPLTAQRRGGLLCDYNAGEVRNGYAWGSRIFTDTTKTGYGSLEVGGILGRQAGTGRISNVYSLVNVIVADPSKYSSGTVSTNYGAVVGGSGSGRIERAYSSGQSIYGQSYNGTFVDYGRGPAGGGAANARFKDVYYWYDPNAYNSGKYDTSLSQYQKQIGLETLHDYSWQATLLGDQFDTQPVEVGYYPHVKLSSELPKQPNIALPAREKARMVDLISANVLDYVDDGQKALVEFRFSNGRNASIRRVDINGLECELDYATEKSEDGYTTVQGYVYNPDKYLSRYEVNGVDYVFNGVLNTISFDPKPYLLVDFYRDVRDANDWYNYVVLKPNENAYIRNDIDFTDVPEARIYVKDNYNGKLKGGDDPHAPGNALKNITLSANKQLFLRLYYDGMINNLTVENLNIRYPKTPLCHSSMIYESYGMIDNLHIRGEVITNYGYIGGICSIMQASSSLTNSSVTDLTINYIEPYNTSTEGRVGGLVGSFASAYLQNCYVRDITVNAGDISDCGGVGGAIGYASHPIIEGVYTTGKLDVRGINVGGVIGTYETNSYNGSITSVVSKMDVISNLDLVGGIIGTSKVTETVINNRNGYSGVSFSNVTCMNPNADNVSYTVGAYMPYHIHFYGTECQMLNGLPYDPEIGPDANTVLGLLTQEQYTNPATYTDNQLCNMQNVYDYSPVTREVLPKLYYKDSHDLLPFQDEDVPMKGQAQVQNEISVTKVNIDRNHQRVLLDIKRPDNFVITGVTIQDLSYVYDQVGSEGLAFKRLAIDYDADKLQRHWLDSYNLTRIDYDVLDASGAVVRSGFADYSSLPIPIGLMMYCDIDSPETWGRYINADNNYGNYENYRIIKNLSFKGYGTYTKNAKIGRLKGDVNGNAATISDIIIGTSAKPKAENLIYNLSTELYKINFKDVDIWFTTRGNIGIIGSTTATIHECRFEDIQIDSANGSNIMGCIGKLNGGVIHDVHYENVKIASRKYVARQSTGGLVGSAYFNATFYNITGKDIEVTGNQNVGGMVGYTNRSNYRNISLEDVKVTGKGVNDYIGGVVGRLNITYENEKSPFFWDVTLKGTPTKDSEGNITGSTTEIISTNKSNYVGGLVGASDSGRNGYDGTAAIATYRTLSAQHPLLVEGAVIRAGGSYVGGGYGYGRDIACLTVRDSLITNFMADGSVFSTDKKNYMGGCIGYGLYESGNNTADHVQVVAQNYDRAGIVYGRHGSNNIGGSYAISSTITAAEKAGVACERIGGLVGWLESGTIYNSGVENCVVHAPDCDNVGGITGYATGTVDRCYVFGNPEDDVTSCSDQAFYVMGANNVGGIVGYHNTSTIARTTNNINVIATEYYAGGISGLYRNAYTESVIDGRTTRSYSNVTMAYNFVAGSIYAKNYAGGATGCNSMTTSTVVKPEMRTMGGRTKDNVGSTGIRSGDNYEYAYTYANFILPTEIACSSTGKAYAFSGSMEGFEGKANRYDIPATTTTKDVTPKYMPRWTAFWAGTKLGKKANWTDHLDTDAALYYIKNADVTVKSDGTYLYKMWDQNRNAKNNLKDYYNYDDYTSGYTNVRLVTYDDLRKARVYYIFQFGRTSSDTSRTMSTGYFLALSNGTKTGDLCYGTAAEWNQMGDKAKALLKTDDDHLKNNYLPMVRNTNSTSSMSDTLVQHLIDDAVVVPISRISMLQRPEGGAAAGMLLLAPKLAEELKLGKAVTAYPVAADRINLEFADNLVNRDVTYRVECGGTVVDEGVLTSRTHTYEYDFNSSFTVTLENEQGIRQGFGFKPNDLVRGIMTDQNRYYYVKDNGIVTGTDAHTTETIPGYFRTLYNGYALNTNGELIHLATKAVEETILDGMRRVGKTPLLQFMTPSGTRTCTYGSYTEYVAADGSVVTRDQQTLASVNGATGLVQSGLDNAKDSYILAPSGSCEHLLVLMENGTVADIYGREDGHIKLPEDFKNEGIVHMSHNLTTTAPFMLVEYKNGGRVGINYRTGEYLFNEFEPDRIGLDEYVTKYFASEAPVFGHLGSAYMEENQIARTYQTTEMLEKQIEKERREGNTESGSNISFGAGSTDGTKQEARDEGNSDTPGLVIDGANASVTGGAVSDGTYAGNGDSLANGTGQEDDTEGEGKEGDSEADGSADGSGAGGSRELHDETERSEETEEGSEAQSTAQETPDASAPDKEANQPNESAPAEAGKTEEPAAEESSDGGLDLGMVNLGGLKTAYNQITGRYEIVDMDRFMTKPNYTSENEILSVDGFAAFLNGGSSSVAEAVAERDINGLLLYILVAVLILLGVGFTMEFRHIRKKKE